jgi:hypothetical protein
MRFGRRTLSLSCDRMQICNMHVGGSVGRRIMEGGVRGGGGALRTGMSFCIDCDRQVIERERKRETC